MTTRRKVLEAVAKVGGRAYFLADDAPRALDVDLAAPDGKVWAGTDLHGVVGCINDPTDTAPAIWARLWHDVKDGVEDCPNPECDVCHPESDHV